MNEFAIGAQPVSGGYIAWFRKVHKADNEVIKEKGGKPKLFATRAEAKAAAGEAMVAYINGNLTRDGARAGRHEAAEALFPTLVKRGRKVAVERKRGAA